MTRHPSPHQEHGFCDMHESMTAVISTLNQNILAVKELVESGNSDSLLFRKEISDQVKAIGMHLQGIERETLGTLVFVADIVQADLKEHKERTEATFAAIQSAAADTHEAMSSGFGGETKEMLLTMTTQMADMNKTFATAIATKHTSTMDAKSKVLVVLIPLLVSMASTMWPSISAALSRFL